MSGDFWSERRALVTGATGLVGSWLVRALLDKGAHVVCLVRDWDPASELIRSGEVQRCSVVNGQLEDFATLQRAVVDHEIQTVFHLGAQTIVGNAYRSPLATFESNIRGTYNLLEVCRLHTSHVDQVVVASSDKAYGESTVLPYVEMMPAWGKHPYDVSKSCTDLLAQAYAYSYGVPVAVARCGNIYGGGDLNWSRIVPGTIRSLYYGKAPVIRSDGKMKRDYLHVDDAVLAYLKIAEELSRAEIQGEAFNFGPAQPLSVLEIVSTIQKLMGREDLKPEILNIAHAEIRDQYLDSSKAKKLLGLKPSVSLEEGLKRTLSWYQSYFSKTAEPTAV